MSEKSPSTGKAKLFLVWGDDDLMVSRRAREIAEDLCPKDKQQFGLETINGEASNAEQAEAAISATISALRTVGFLGDGKTVWLRDAQFLDAGIVGKAKSVKEALGRLADFIGAGIADGSHLLISSEKIFRGSSFYKTCAAKGEIFEYNLASSAKEKSQDSISFAKELLKSENIRIDKGALQAFLNRCGNDKHQISQEVAKLAAYQDENTPLLIEDITALTTANVESEYWELADAISKRDAKNALNILQKQLQLGGSPIGMVIGIEKKLQQLLIIRECLRLKYIDCAHSSASWRGGPEGDSLLDGIIVDKRQDPRKMHPYRLCMLCKDAMNYSRLELKRGLKYAIETHEKMVSAGLSDTAMIELLIVRLTNRLKRG